MRGPNCPTRGRRLNVVARAAPAESQLVQPFVSAVVHSLIGKHLFLLHHRPDDAEQLCNRLDPENSRNSSFPFTSLS